MGHWPPIAQRSKNHAHATTQRIFNKIIEIKLSLQCMVLPRCCPFYDGSLALKILIYNAKNCDYLAESMIQNCPTNRKTNSLHAFGLVKVKRDNALQWGVSFVPFPF